MSGVFVLPLCFAWMIFLEYWCQHLSYWQREFISEPVPPVHVCAIAHLPLIITLPLTDQCGDEAGMSASLRILQPHMSFPVPSLHRRCRSDCAWERYNPVSASTIAASSLKNNKDDDNASTRDIVLGQFKRHVNTYYCRGCGCPEHKVNKKRRGNMGWLYQTFWLLAQFWENEK